MNLREKFSRLAQLLILITNHADREITDYWRNFFNKEDHPK